MAESPLLDETAGAPKLTLKDMMTYFCHSGQYCTSSPEWPNITIMYYMYEVSREPTENTQAQQVDGDQMAAQLEQLHINPRWYRTVSKIGEAHAEAFMIQELEPRQEIQALQKGDTLRIIMVISYSPCNACSTLLQEFKQRTEVNGAKVEVCIRVANFYRHPIETEKLSKLVQGKVFKLSIFQGVDDWKKFYKDVNGKEIPELLLNEDRIQREKADAKINKEIHGIKET